MARLIIGWILIAFGLACVVGGVGLGYMTWYMDRALKEQARIQYWDPSSMPARNPEWDPVPRFGIAGGSVVVGVLIFFAGLNVRPQPGWRRAGRVKSRGDGSGEKKRKCADCGGLIPGHAARCYHCSRVIRDDAMDRGPRGNPRLRRARVGPPPAPPGRDSALPVPVGTAPTPESLLAEQARLWGTGERVLVEALLPGVPHAAADRDLVLDLIYQEILLRERAGERPTKAEYVARFPALAAELSLQFQIDGLLGSPGQAPGSTTPGTHSPLERTGPFLSEGDPVTADRPRGADLIAGRYELGPELARGGMGVVHRAIDRAFSREVAIKRMNPRLAGTPASDRFFEESRITGQLQHPSIPPVHEVGTLPDGSPYLVMKLIRGRTLAEEVAATPRPSGRAAVGPEGVDAEEEREAVEQRNRLFRVFEQICLAVAFAHSRRFIHRDLKPQNVMVGAFGEVQVMDWGLAKSLASPVVAPVTPGVPEPEFGDGPEDRTRAGDVVGTPAYMPPEQARGENHRVDERADVFALGGILTMILTGQPPYAGKTGREVWEKAAEADLAEALDRLDAVVGAGRFPWLAKKCLAADSRERFDHAGTVAAAVHDAFAKAEQVRRQEELTVATLEADQAERRALRTTRRAVQLGVGSLLLAALALVGSWTYVNSNAQLEEHQKELQKEKLSAARGEWAKAEYPILFDAISRGIDAGRFAPKWDGEYRGRMHRRLDDVMEHLGGEDKVRAHLVRAAMFDANEDGGLAQDEWYAAVKLYKETAPDRTEFALACESAGWFGLSQHPGRMERLVLTRAVRIISPVAEAESTPADVRRRATAALDIAAKAGVRPPKS